MPRDYNVIVREVHKTTVSVEANSPEEAIRKVWKGEGDYYPGTTFCYTMRPEHWTVEDPEDYTPTRTMRSFNSDSGELTILLDPNDKHAYATFVPWQTIESAPRDGTIIESRDKFGIEDVICYDAKRRCVGTCANPPASKYHAGWLSVTMDYLPTAEPAFWRPILTNKF